MIPVIWTEPALGDLEKIRLYISEFNPIAAREAAARIIEAGNGLAFFPLRGRAVPNSRLREVTIAYPYIIRYRVGRERVVILRVRHGARR